MEFYLSRVVRLPPFHIYLLIIEAIYIYATKQLRHIHIMDFFIDDRKIRPLHVNSRHQYTGYRATTHAMKKLLMSAQCQAPRLYITSDRHQHGVMAPRYHRTRLSFSADN